MVWAKTRKIAQYYFFRGFKLILGNVLNRYYIVQLNLKLFNLINLIILVRIYNNLFSILIFDACYITKIICSIISYYGSYQLK